MFSTTNPIWSIFILFLFLWLFDEIILHSIVHYYWVLSPNQCFYFFQFCAVAQLTIILGIFFPPIFWYSWSDDNPRNDFARLGYMLDMKVGGKTRFLVYSWLPTGTYHQNLAIWIFFFKIWQIQANFSMKNPLHNLKSYFSGWNFAKFRPQK